MEKIWKMTRSRKMGKKKESEKGKGDRQKTSARHRGPLSSKQWRVGEKGNALWWGWSLCRASSNRTKLGSKRTGLGWGIGKKKNQKRETSVASPGLTFKDLTEGGINQKQTGGGRPVKENHWEGKRVTMGI